MAESKRREGATVVRNSPGAGAVVRRRSTEPSGSPSSALGFLERSHRSESASLPATWPAGFVPPPKTDRERGRAAHSGNMHVPRLPRTSALAFLERPPIGGAGTSTNSIVTGAGAEAGLGSLSGGVMATGSGRGGFLPRVHSSIGGSGSEDSDELDELDSDICPSMLFSCFPCLSWFGPSKHSWQPDLLDGGSIENMGGSNASIKRNSRTKKGLGRPLLVDQPLPDPDFPKDVKLIEVDVESARNLPLGERVNMADLAGTYAILRVTPAQEGVGEQAEMTSLATRPVNPSWRGRETFTFFVTDTGNSKAFLAIQILYRPLRSPSSSSTSPSDQRPPPLRRETSGLSTSTSPPRSLPGGRPGDVVIGEGFVDLLGLFPPVDATYTPGALKGNSRRVAVPMREPEGKMRTKCSVMLGLRCRRVNETIDTHEDRIYEYERWTNVAGWSASGKRREGKWSTLDGSVLSDTFADVAPPARDNAEVVLPWCPFGGWEYSRVEVEEEKSSSPSASARTGRTPSKTSSSRSGDQDDDSATSTSAAEGWDNCAVAQKGAVWMEGYIQGYQAVRRRLWRRVYLKRGSASVGSAPESGAVTVPPPL
eukprot:g16333.t1